MKELSNRQTAEKMALESITDNIKFSIEFYKKEIEQAKAENNEYMIEHCTEMVRAYNTLNFMIKHFKF